jgi:hypothetical protein
VNLHPNGIWQVEANIIFTSITDQLNTVKSYKVVRDLKLRKFTTDPSKDLLALIDLPEEVELPVGALRATNLTPHLGQVRILHSVLSGLIEQRKRTGNLQFQAYPNGRQFGKTRLIDTILWLGATIPSDVFGPPEVLLISDTYDHANIAWSTFYQRIEGTPALKNLIARTSVSEHSLTLKTGAMIFVRSADRPSSLSGMSPSLVIIDEAQFVSDMAMKVLLPSTITRMCPVLAFGIAEGSSWFQDWADKARDGHRQYVYNSFTTYANPMQTISAIDTMCESFDASHVLSNYLAEWPIIEGGKVYVNVNNCIDFAPNQKTNGVLIEPIENHFYVWGIDLGKHQDYTVIYGIDTVNGRCVFFDRFLDVFWPIQKQRIKEAVHYYKRGPIALDAAGIGDVIYDDLLDMGLWVEPIRTNIADEKMKLIHASKKALEEEIVKIPNIEVLIKELNAYSYQRLQSGRFRYSSPEGTHDDCVLAFMLACFMRQQYHINPLLSKPVERKPGYWDRRTDA